MIIRHTRVELIKSDICRKIDLTTKTIVVVTENYDKEEEKKNLFSIWREPWEDDVNSSLNKNSANHAVALPPGIYTFKNFNDQTAMKKTKIQSYNQHK